MNVIKKFMFQVKAFFIKKLIIFYIILFVKLTDLLMQIHIKDEELDHIIRHFFKFYCACINNF